MKRLDSHGRLLSIFFAVFLFKFFSLYYYYNLTLCEYPKFYGLFMALSSGDTFSYFEPIQNYIKYGEYYLTKGDRAYYAVRPPYYGVLYLALDSFMQESAIPTAISVINILFDAASTLAISIIVGEATKSKGMFYFCLLVSTLSINMSHLAVYLIPDSLVISFTTLSLFYCFRAKAECNSRKLIVSSALIAVSIGLRPYIALLLPAMIWYSIEHQAVSGLLRMSIRKIVLVLIPIVLIIGPWTVRNYVKYDSFAPYEYDLINAYYGEDFVKSPQGAKRRFLTAIGESDIPWDIASAASFFEPDHSEYKINSKYKFPVWLRESVPMSQLESIRSMLVTGDVDQVTTNAFDHLVERIKSESPIRYYLLNNFKRVSYMIGHSGSYYLPISKKFTCFKQYQLIWKVFESFVYWMAIIFFPLGVFVMIMEKNRFFVPLISLPLSVIVLSAFVIQHSEYRYFHYAFPAVLISAMIGFRGVALYLVRGRL